MLIYCKNNKKCVWGFRLCVQQIFQYNIVFCLWLCSQIDKVWLFWWRLLTVFWVLYPEDVAIRFLQTIGICHTIWCLFPENIKVFISVKLQHCVVYTFQFLYLETYRVGKWGETKEEGGARAVFASLSRRIPPPMSSFHEYLPSVKIQELDCRTSVHDKKDDMGTECSR